MNDKLRAFLEALRTGEALTSAVRARQYANLVGLLASLLGALVVLARAYGYNVTPLSNEDLATIATLLLSAWSAVRALISKAANPEPALPRKAKDEPPVDDDKASA